MIANWPASREEHWLALLRARAIENQAWVFGVNRCGRDPKLIYGGMSVLYDPMGRVVVDGGDGEKLVRGSIDPEAARKWRRDFPALADIHRDLLPRVADASDRPGL